MKMVDILSPHLRIFNLPDICLHDSKQDMRKKKMQWWTTTFTIFLMNHCCYIFLLYVHIWSQLLKIMLPLRFIYIYTYVYIYIHIQQCKYSTFRVQWHVALLNSSNIKHIVHSNSIKQVIYQQVEKDEDKYFKHLPSLYKNTLGVPVCCSIVAKVYQLHFLPFLQSTVKMLKHGRQQIKQKKKINTTTNPIQWQTHAQQLEIITLECGVSISWSHTVSFPTTTQQHKC